MIKIKLNGKKGVDYNAYVDSYFADFTMNGFPYFLPDPSKYSGKELLLLGENHGKNTQALILDGKQFAYDFSAHIVSGTLTKVTLATLGKSYKKGGEFKTDKKGLIAHTTDTVEISGLKISNQKDVKGDFHNVVGALMGGVSGDGETGGGANAALLMSFVNGEGQKVKGTKKGDSYKGTDFADKVNLDKGDDVLNGASGNDTLKGGKGKDTFVFDTALGPNNVDKIKDFDPKDDTIHLSASIFAGLATGKLDADAFTIGSGASDANDRIIYDKKSGVLSFDADGTGGIAPVEFARLGKNLDLHADDFLVI
jgi:Ca2+-binding RTX toxin-like protein